MSLSRLCKSAYVSLPARGVVAQGPAARLLGTSQRGFGSGSLATLAPHASHRRPQQREPLDHPRTLATLADIPPPNQLELEPVSKGKRLSSEDELPPLERYIYDRVQAVSPSAPLLRIYREYKSNAGRVLNSQIPYEPRPNASRRTGAFDLHPSGEGRTGDDGVFLVAHVAIREDGQRRISLSSGFALAPDRLEEENKENGQCVVTCCHTLEEINRSVSIETLVPPSGIYVLPALGEPIPVAGVLSSLPRHDILLLSLPSPSQGTPHLRTLPLSPYPAPRDSALSVRLLSSPGRPELQSAGEQEGWTRWLDGHALRKWSTGGKVLGYRDLAGRESETGTYDALSHILFNTLPTPGSSGAPLVDEYGAVVGMALGTRMDNRVEGNRGWGVPAELIFEMFSLPGLKLNRK